MDIVPITAQYLRGLKAANEEKTRMAMVKNHVVRIMELITTWASLGVTKYSEEVSFSKGWPYHYEPRYRETLDDVLGLLKKNIIGAKIEYQGTILVVDWS